MTNVHLCPPAGIAIRPRSLVELLRSRAAHQPERLAYTFLDADGHETALLTYARLDRRARGVAARLQERGAAGGRVLLLYPHGPDYLVAFLGCLYAGAVAVPAYPPRLNQSRLRLEAIVADAQATLALTTHDLLSRLEPVLAGSPQLRALDWVATDTGDWEPETWREPDLAPEALAYLQYTSGSTGTPKGVRVTHANLLHNEGRIAAAFGQTESSVIVSWLPLYHDMGLIGGALQPLYLGARTVFLSPTAFLQRPARWLEAVSRYGATTSGGPNFAYDLCVRRVSEEQKAALDLRTWAVAFNGAEPVRAETLESFADAFASCGFRSRAFAPCYGLAEATLLVAGGHRPEGPLAARFEADQLRQGRAVPAADGDRAARALLAYDASAGDQKLAVVDPETLTACGSGQVGEVWIASPSVADGYWARPDETAQVFGASLGEPPAGTFLRTGDLGVLHEGRLFITGRLKDLIVVRGQNHYPQDVELTVERSHPALRPGCGAAFALEAAGQEQLVIAHELAPRRGTAPADEILAAIRRRVTEEHGLQPHAVALVEAGGIPKTSSGKIQRRACRAAFLDGSLPVVEQWSAGRERGDAAAGQAALPPDEPLDLRMARLVAGKLGMEETEVDVAAPLTSYGIDSVTAVELAHGFETLSGQPVSVASILRGASVAELAAAAPAALDEAAAGQAPPAPAGVHPLSHGQRALWFLRHMQAADDVYTIARAARVRGALDVDALRRAFQRVVDRHACLRTTFESLDGEPVQRVHPRAEVAFRSHAAAAWDAAELDARLLEQAQRPFDLERGPLLRVDCYRRAAGEHVIVLAIHHIVADFWSLGVLMSEVGEFYREETGGPRAVLPAVEQGYAEHVRRQAQLLSGASGAKLRDYWRTQLAGELPLLDLPADRPRPKTQTLRGDALYVRLDERLTRRLEGLARAEGTTLYTVLLAAFQVLLWRYSGQDDVLVGSPAAGRTRAEDASSVGYFVNAVVVRVALAGDLRVREFLARVRAAVLGALEHQEYPFDLLVRQLQPVRSANRPPLFQAMFALQRSQFEEQAGLASFALQSPEGRLELGTLALEPWPLPHRLEPFDLTLVMAEESGRLGASFQYNADLFDAGTIGRLSSHFVRLLEGLAGGPQQRLAELPLMGESERRTVVGEWNATGFAFPGERCVHELVAEWAARTPDALAVAAPDARLSYAELARDAQALARRLRALGVGPGARVGVYVERSAAMVVGLLGVLAAGAAYLPLDPELPGERLRGMARDAGLGAVVTVARLRQRAPFDGDVELVCVDDVEPGLGGAPVTAGATPGDVAYVIYTSGSSGAPKGVEIEHRALLSLVFWHRRVYRLGPGERGSQLAAMSFDASVWELWPCLASGASLHLADDETRLAPRRLRDWLLAEGVTVAFVPTPLAEPLLREDWPRETALRVLLTGGDRLTQRPPAGLPFTLINHYGPTEATVVTTAGRVAPAAEPGPVPSIGRPIDNQRVHVLDRDLWPLPAGVPGELFIGGACLARGYLGRPELTAEKFVPDPFALEPGSRLYASGDRVRWRADGELEFLGRVDDQVKVRGFRIELGEIVAALQAHGALAAAAAVVREDTPGERRLVAYVVPRDGAPSAPELRDFLRARLPEYMLPAAFVSLASLPLTPHGKLDRRALPAPERGDARAPYEAPRTALETSLCGIWSDVLELPRVGLHDDFFELGGHSLLAMRVAARVRQVCGVELPVRLLFEQPSVARLAPCVEQLTHVGGDAHDLPIPRARRDRPLPASQAQQRLWFLDQLRPGAPAYNMPGALRLEGPLDVAALGRALDALVRRHEALRTTFAMAEGEPVQVVAPAGATPLPVADLTHLPPAARAEEARRRAGEEARRPFDLAKGPLLRGLLLGLDADEHVLLITVHHIVCDGWSLGVLVRELGLLYEAFRAGHPAPLPEPSLQYADFARWQQDFLKGDVVARQLAYWRERLGDGPPPLELPADRPRPATESFRGALEPFTLAPETTQRLEALARREGATLFMVLLAAFEALLHRYTGQSDVVVGTPSAGRNRAELEGLVGFFVNTLVLRTDLSGDPSFRELVARVRAETLDAYARQDVPFERLVEELHPARDLSRNPLFQVMFVLRTAPFGELSLPGLRTQLLEVDSGTSKLDLTLTLEESSEGLRGWLEYSTDLFERERMRRLAAHFVALAEEFAADPRRRLSQVELLSPAERARLLVEWTVPRLPPHEDLALHELFERQAARTPSAPALVHGRDEWSYEALERRANRIARRLRRLGVGPEVRVGVCTRRAPQLVAGLLGVLKAGGAYVPLDPNYPAERVAYMLADSGAALVLAEGGLPAALAGARVQVLRLDDAFDAESDAALEPVVSARGLAYVIYTSGSTGRPKGVAIEHHSAVVFAHWARGEFDDGELRGVLAATSICFDLSIFEIFVTLGWGGTVYLAEDALELPRLARRDEVTLVNSVPSALAELVRQQALPPSVRTVNLAGEPLTGALVERIYAGGPVERVLNLYGPSEDTTYSTFTRVPRGAETPTVGRPIANTRVYLLDRYGALVPPGVPGELHLGGDGLARGYLGRPELTAEKFVPDPFGGVPGARLYRTGDLARYRPDGELDFLGRIDQQVKVRGFRIELGEIEAALGAHPAVDESVVVVREDVPGDRRLVAYVVPRGEARPQARELRAALAQRLPEYMLPGAVVVLAALPRTPNGKLDRRALPAPEAPVSSADAEGGAPRTPLEQRLASIWAQVLGREHVGLHDDFFELGGHSLLAMRVAARVQQDRGVELPVRLLFEQPTVARLARRVEELERAQGAAPPAPITAAPRDRPVPASYAQQRLWFLEQLNPGTPVYNMPAALRLDGALDVAALERTLDDVVRRHEALRTTFAVAEGRPVQVVAPAGRAPLAVVDLTHLPRAGRDDEARRRAEEEARRPFDLAAGPLYRAVLVRLDAAEHVLLLTLHHIVCDGWSLGVLVDEVAALYGAFSRGLPSPLPEPALHYADFAVWQRGWLQGEVLERQLDYWRRCLGHELPALELPADSVRSPGAGRAALHELRLPAALARALSELSRGEECSLFMTLLAAFKVLLQRHTRADDVAVGSGIANRTRPEFEPLVGFFVNTVVMRTDLSGDPTFRELLKRVRDTALGAYAHQDVPFERVVEALQPARHASQAPFFNVCFFLQNAARQTLLELPGVRVTALPIHCGLARFDLTLSIVEEAQGLTAVFEYDAGLFQSATIEALARSFEVLLGALVADPDGRIAALPLLAPDDRRRVVAGWNATAVAYPRERCVHELFAQQVERAPDAVALVTDERRMSFAELDARAEQVARRLAALGVGLESRVGVFLERSPQAIVSLLGILKAGAAYLPLDPGLPLERLDFMLNDAGAGVVVSREDLLERLPVSLAFQTLCLDDDAAAPAASPAGALSAGHPPEALAYVMYTSGSTGRPKGTEVNHRNIVRLVKGADYAPFRPGEVFLQFAPLSFDAATFEIWGSLLNGATLALMPPEAASLHELADAVRRHGVTTLWLTAGLYHLMLDEQPEALASVPWVLAGGEALSPAHVRRHLASCGEGRVVNGYGPTETTTFACCHVMDRHARLDGTVPIGRPIANTRVYLLDPQLEPVPPGALGEIFIGGDGVARGYGGRPGLTAERFVPDAFAAVPGARLYRTGDLARHRPDGTLEFRGRLDDQVKVRGFRIEPAEIEAALAEHSRVKEAVVLPRELAPGDLRLVAYVVAHDAADSGESAAAQLVPLLRQHVERLLPAYMAPAAYVLLAQLPLTPNGKVDRRVLPLPDELAPEHGSEPPRTPVEELLAGVFADVLGTRAVSREDDFFELGGHSLLATQVVSRIREVLGVELPLRALFEAPSVAGLAPRIEEELRGGATPAPPLRRCQPGTSLPLSYAQQRLWFIDRLEPGTPVYNCPGLVRLRGQLDVQALERALSEIVRRHEALRTRFRDAGAGPVQEPGPALALSLEIEDLSGLEEPARAAALQRLAHVEAVRPFDLERDLMLRARLVRLGDEHHVLLFVVHHIASDGWSLGVLLREVGLLYDAFRLGEESPLPELELQYGDYAVWQREWLRGPVLERQVAYWRERLAGAPEVLALPTDHPRPEVKTRRGAQHAFLLPAVLVERLDELSRAHGATLFMTLLAALQALLGWLSRQEDVVVAAPVANRTRQEIEGLIGFFVNMLVLRTDLSGEPAFVELLARVRETALAAYAHQDLPFERLVEELNPERSLSHSPLFQVAFTLQNYPAPEPALAGLELALEVEDMTISAKIDLNLIMQRSPRGLEASWIYDPDLWNASTIQAWSDHLVALAGWIVADPGVTLATLGRALSEADRERQSEQQRRFENARAEKLGRLRRPQAPA